MNAEKFWLGWLKVTIAIIVTGGLFFVFFSHTKYMNLIDYQINKVFFAGNLPDSSTMKLQHWMTGVMGSIMVGWGCFMFYLIYQPFRRKELWAWRCMFYSILFWYILDSSVSGYYGALFNILLNCILFLQILAPLLFLRNSFLNVKS